MSGDKDPMPLFDHFDFLAPLYETFILPCASSG